MESGWLVWVAGWMEGRDETRRDVGTASTGGCSTRRGFIGRRCRPALLLPPSAAAAQCCCCRPAQVPPSAAAAQHLASEAFSASRSCRSSASLSCLAAASTRAVRQSMPTCCAAGGGERTAAQRVAMRPLQPAAALALPLWRCPYFPPTHTSPVPLPSSLHPSPAPRRPLACLVGEGLAGRGAGVAGRHLVAPCSRHPPRRRPARLQAEVWEWGRSGTGSQRASPRASRLALQGPVAILWSSAGGAPSPPGALSRDSPSTAESHAGRFIVRMSMSLQASKRARERGQRVRDVH